MARTRPVENAPPVCCKKNRTSEDESVEALEPDTYNFGGSLVRLTDARETMKMSVEIWMFFDL